MDMRDHTEIPILLFRMMDKINIKMDEACGVIRKGRCYMSEAKRIKARKNRKKKEIVMTNSEKAREIADKIVKASNERAELNDYHDVKRAALEMAEWKDQQIKEYLEKKHEEFTIKGTFENSYDWGRRSAIEAIIDELFGKTKQDNSDRDE